ncbi:MAG: hypothetical protein AAGJ81_01210 [Verrucomicrobiota bacterium]
MSLSASEGRPLEDFSRYLATEEAPLVVGGQAVNLWALFYRRATEGLEPFVSKDVDLLGDRKLLEEVARLGGVKPHFFPLKPPSNEVGYAAPVDGSDMPLVIEVLRWVNGVSSEELLRDSVIMGVGPSKIPVRLPSPVYLLKAKLANMTSISQEGRQDAKHLEILWRVIPAYFDQMIKSLTDGKRTERDVVNLLGTLLEIVTSSPSPAILEQLQLSSDDLFSGLPNSRHHKIASFRKHQLTRAFSSDKK